jgi:hypothetical protein
MGMSSQNIQKKSLKLRGFGVSAGSVSRHIVDITAKRLKRI